MRKTWLLLLVLVVMAFVAMPAIAAAVDTAGPPGGGVVAAKATVEVDQGAVTALPAFGMRQQAAWFVVLMLIALSAAETARRTHTRRDTMKAPIGLTEGGWSLSSA